MGEQGNARTVQQCKKINSPRQFINTQGNAVKRKSHGGGKIIPLSIGVVGDGECAGRTKIAESLERSEKEDEQWSAKESEWNSGFERGLWGNLNVTKEAQRILNQDRSMSPRVAGSCAPWERKRLWMVTAWRAIKRDPKHHLSRFRGCPVSH